MTDDDSAALDRFEALARQRRTNLRMDPDKAVSDRLVRRLCELAQWAPNHHRTWPWRFAALTGDARVRLGACVADDLRANGGSEAQVSKAEGKYCRAPLMLAVAVAHQPDDEAERRAEDRDAAAAGVQNVLLAATAAGLASYWGSGRVLRLPAVRQLCGFGDGDSIIALIYLGHPTGHVAAPPRPVPALTFVA